MFYIVILYSPTLDEFKLDHSIDIWSIGELGSYLESLVKDMNIKYEVEDFHIFSVTRRAPLDENGEGLL